MSKNKCWRSFTSNSTKFNADQEILYPMNILCLHPFLSMRAVKEMAALKQKKHKVVLVYEGLGCSVENGYGTFWDRVLKLPSDTFKGEYYCRRLFPKTYQKVLSHVLKKNDFDIIHAYGMPDTLAVAAIRYTSLPVIFDSRDISSGADNYLLIDFKFPILNKLQERIYKKFIIKYEKEANENSDGRIYCTSEMLKYVGGRYKIDMNQSIALENFQTMTNIDKNSLPKNHSSGTRKHLVYTGNICFDKKRRIEELFLELTNHFIHLHIYPNGDMSAINYFKKMYSGSKFIHFHHPLTPKELSKEIIKYDFGLVPHPPDIRAKNIRLVLPNKLFDYLAVGLPIAGRNTFSLKNFIKKNNVGFIYNTPQELVRKLGNEKDKYKIQPEKFLMENHIDSVITLYNQILAKGSDHN